MKKQLLLCCLFITVVASSQKNWELVKNEYEIKIFTRKTDTTTIKEYLATTIVNAPIDSVCKKILDVKNLHLWNFKTTANTILKKTNDSTWIIYMQNTLDWPVKNRDHVSKLVLFKKKNDYFLYLTPENKMVKEKQGIIRIKNFKGFWHLNKINNTQTKVTQQMYGDPGGNIPVILINSMLTRAPLETFRKLKFQLENSGK